MATYKEKSKHGEEVPEEKPSIINAIWVEGGWLMALYLLLSVLVPEIVKAFPESWGFTLTAQDLAFRLWVGFSLLALAVRSYRQN